MLQNILMILLSVLGAAGFSLWLSLGVRQRRRERLRRQFGHVPEKHKGLAVAEDFLIAQTRAHPLLSTVDDTTWADLDGDGLFYNMNNCQSAPGDVALYTTLRRPASKEEDVRAHLNRLETTMAPFADEKLRVDVQYALSRLGRLDAVGMEMTLFRPKALAMKNRWLYWLLAFLPLVSVAFFWVNLPFAIVCLVATVTANFYLAAWMKEKNDSGYRWIRYLASCISCAKKLQRLLAGKEPALASRLQGAISGLGGVRASIALLNFDHYSDENVGFDIANIFLLPQLAYGHVAGKLQTGTQGLQELYDALGQIDLAICLLSWQRLLPLWCKPTFTSQKTLDFKTLYHPLLDEPVANSACFEKDVLLTGSNASGKSTFIKSIALNCLFAQTTGICTAEAYTMRCGTVATSMAARDSVVEGDSYFVAEIKSMRRLIQLSEKETFSWFFIDEILRGTNTVERVAAASAVLHQLAAAPCFCFAATHDIELTQILNQFYENYHFSETVESGVVLFDYHLRRGPTKTRNAILLLEQMGFANATTKTARQLVARFETKGEWGTLP